MTKKKATKKPTKGEGEATIPKAMLLRIKPTDGQRLNELAERVPWASKHQLALEALRLGLAELESDPTKLISKG